MERRNRCGKTNTRPFFFFEPLFDAKHDQFTETSSGQTLETLSKKEANAFFPAGWHHGFGCAPTEAQEWWAQTGLHQPRGMVGGCGGATKTNGSFCGGAGCTAGSNPCATELNATELTATELLRLN